jgi:hypothetical protein
MIGALALLTGIPPSVLWVEDPVDLATLADLVRERADLD